MPPGPLYGPPQLTREKWDQLKAEIHKHDMRAKLEVHGPPHFKPMPQAGHSGDKYLRWIGPAREGGRSRSARAATQSGCRWTCTRC